MEKYHKSIIKPAGIKGKMIEEAVINESIQRDEKACKMLYERSIPYVYSIVKRYIWEEDARKDVIQDIYANVFKKLTQFDNSRGDFKSWIRRISINQALMQLRTNEKSGIIVPISSNEKTEPVEELQVEELSREEIDAILDKMPIGYRTIFLLIVIDEYSHEDVSELLNISKETSRSQLSRAKKWLRKYFLSTSNLKVDGIF